MEKLVGRWRNAENCWEMKKEPQREPSARGREGKRRVKQTANSRNGTGEQVEEVRKKKKNICG